MIISRKYKFVFIKNMKVAGTSVERFLWKFLGNDDVATPCIGVDGKGPRNHDGFKNHMSLWEIRKRLDDDLSNYIIFCIERRPDTKALSHLLHINSNRRKRGEAPLDGKGYIDFQPNACSNFWRYQIHGEKAVDYIVRYETLNEDLAVIFDRLGIPYSGDLGFWERRRPDGYELMPEDFFTPSELDYIWGRNVLENKYLKWRATEEIDPTGAYTKEAMSLCMRKCR